MPIENPRGRQALEISSAFTALAFFVVLLRLYARFHLVRCAGLEDYGIVLAMICSIGLTIAIGYQAKWGMGQHLNDIPPETVQMSLQAFWASLIVYYLSLGLTKTSILLQYLRVFTTKKFQITCWGMLGVVVVYTIWTVFSSIFACVPVRAFWTREHATCINQFAMWFTNAGINIVTDFALIVLPIPVIRSLNLGRRQKIALISIFAVGGFVCIVSILRLQSLVAISNSVDPTYDNPPAATWSSVEINVGIICSCLPLLRPLLTRFLPGAFTSKARTANNDIGPKHYATIRSMGGKKGGHSRDDDSMELTKHSHEGGNDIQVVTDISVQVEGGSGRLSGWRTPNSKPDWGHKEDSRSEINTPIKDVGHIV